MSKPQIKIANDDQLIKGSSHLYRSQRAAFAQSQTVTTAPGVTEFCVGDTTFYAADGDYYITNNGARGQYLYGKGGKLLSVEHVTM